MCRWVVSCVVVSWQNLSALPSLQSFNLARINPQGDELHS
jgi:hypothetical protein